MEQEILLAQPRGFCAGVDRAIEIVERALAQFGAPIYVRHEIVHNAYVVEDLRRKGAIFIEQLADVPPGNTLVFSAHGVPRSVQEEAARRGLTVFDATCPLVTKVHVEVAKMRREDREIIMIGHAGHPEVEGTMGQANEGMYLVETAEDVGRLQVRNPDLLAYVTQTTLSVDDTADVIAALKQRFPTIAEPKKGDICYATTNRQEAVVALAAATDLVLVVGSANSSNSVRLVEVAERAGVPAHLVEDAGEVDLRWLAGTSRVGITAGASAPPHLVDDLVRSLSGLGPVSVREEHVTDEDVVFAQPLEVS
jgi:4-hydroxy-3-methylbut-2-enyl diphosphate reductase